MTWYRTLVPISYVQGNSVISIENPGTQVDLTPTQAAGLQGMVALDDTTQFPYPRGDVLFYKYFVLLPAQGQPNTIYYANDTALLYHWSDVSQTYSAIGIPESWDAIDTDERDDISNGESSMSRRYITGSGVVAAGTLALSFFTARKTQPITQLKTISGTQAAVGATLCRIGLYAVDANSNLSLAAATSNNASLWGAANTAYSQGLTSAYSLVRGNRYAIGVLAYGASTAPSFIGATTIPAAESFLAPTLGASVTGQTDLPSTVAVGSLAPIATIPYCVVLP